MEDIKLIGKNMVILAILFLLSCNHTDDIVTLLNSEETNDVILGAFKAGKSGNIKYIPLLIENADDRRMSTDIKFKGVTVYQSKMIALKKIYKKEPPAKITYKVDSSVIIFFKNLQQ